MFKINSTAAMNDKLQKTSNKRSIFLKTFNHSINRTLKHHEIDKIYVKAFDHATMKTLHSASNSALYEELRSRIEPLFYEHKQNFIYRLGLEILCTNKITKNFINCHKIEQTDKTHTKLNLDCQNAIINLDCQDTITNLNNSFRIVKIELQKPTQFFSQINPCVDCQKSIYSIENTTKMLIHALDHYNFSDKNAIVKNLDRNERTFLCISTKCNPWRKPEIQIIEIFSIKPYLKSQNIEIELKTDLGFLTIIHNSYNSDRIRKGRTDSLETLIVHRSAQYSMLHSAPHSARFGTVRLALKVIFSKPKTYKQLLKLEYDQNAANYKYHISTSIVMKKRYLQNARCTVLRTARSTVQI